jgi:hypothetical protein
MKACDVPRLRVLLPYKKNKIHQSSEDRLIWSLNFLGYNFGRKYLWTYVCMNFCFLLFSDIKFIPSVYPQILDLPCLSIDMNVIK